MTVEVRYENVWYNPDQSDRTESWNVTAPEDKLTELIKTLADAMAIPKDIMNANQNPVEDHDSEVNHPAHYTQYRGVEVIQLTEQMNFNRGNCVKYVARAGYKGDTSDEIKDLNKARWYLEREIAKLEELLGQG